LLSDGVNTTLWGLNADTYPDYYFFISGILAWASGVFFAFHRETWKNIALILLAGYLIARGSASLTVYDPAVSPNLLLIAVLFGIPLAIIFLLQRQRLSANQNSEA
jgi:hypothetical protein